MTDLTRAQVEKLVGDPREVVQIQAVQPDLSIPQNPNEYIASLRARLEASHKERVRFQKYYETAGKLNGELKARLEAVERERDEAKALSGKDLATMLQLTDELVTRKAQLATAQARVRELEEKYVK